MLGKTGLNFTFVNHWPKKKFGLRNDLISVQFMFMTEDETKFQPDFRDEE